MISTTGSEGFAVWPFAEPLPTTYYRCTIRALRQASVGYPSSRHALDARRPPFIHDALPIAHLCPSLERATSTRQNQRGKINEAKSTRRTPPQLTCIRTALNRSSRQSFVESVNTGIVEENVPQFSPSVISHQLGGTSLSERMVHGERSSAWRLGRTTGTRGSCVKASKNERDDRSKGRY